VCVCELLITPVTFVCWYGRHHSLRHLPAHVILAIERAEKLNILNVKIILSETSQTHALNLIKRLFIRPRQGQQSQPGHGRLGPVQLGLLNAAVKDAFKRLILPALTRSLSLYIYIYMELLIYAVFKCLLSLIIMEKEFLSPLLFCQPICLGSAPPVDCVLF